MVSKIFNTFFFYFYTASLVISSPITAQTAADGGIGNRRGSLFSSTPKHHPVPEHPIPPPGRGQLEKTGRAEGGYHHDSRSLNSSGGGSGNGSCSTYSFGQPSPTVSDPDVHAGLYWFNIIHTINSFRMIAPMI